MLDLPHTGIKQIFRPYYQILLYIFTIQLTTARETIPPLVTAPSSQAEIKQSEGKA